MVHHVSMEYIIVPSMREELHFFAEYLKISSSVTWETPTYVLIAFLIERTLFASSYGDAYLDAARGYSTDSKFWWHIKFSIKVVLRTLTHLTDNKNGRLISINVLEFNHRLLCSPDSCYDIKCHR